MVSNTPEARLVAAVLMTFIDDMRAQQPLSKLHKDVIIRQADTEWVALLCSFIGLDHGIFVRKLNWVRQQKKWKKPFNASIAAGVRKRHESSSVSTACN